jgi:serine/threonine protein kinase
MSKYIAHGSYGCVISPNINCDKSFGNEKKITKFFYNKYSYDIELKYHKKVEKIDKTHAFTPKLIHNCEIILTKDIKNKIINFHKCELKSNELYQISYEYRGVDLFSLFIKYTIDIDFYLFLQQFLIVFEGLCKLNENNLSHTDIRINNILYENYKFTIIDFGLMQQTKFFYTEKNLLRFQNHPNYPNDIIIFKEILNGRFHKYLYQYKLNTIEFLELIQINIDIIILKPDFPLKHKILDIYNYLMLREFDNDDYYFFQKIDIKYIRKNSKLLGDKLDVYMLGLVLYEIILLIITHSKKKSMEYIPPAIFDLIKKMVLLNPEKRITIQDATEEYKKIMGL